MGLFSIFPYTFTINCVTTGARQLPIEYLERQCMKIISSRTKCGLFCSVFKKIIPNNTTPTFQEVCGGNVTPHILSMALELLMVSR